MDACWGNALALPLPDGASLDDMASSMARELTQPLAAMLEQAQAAKTLAAQGDTDRATIVVKDVVGQTLYACDILDGLRT